MMNYAVDAAFMAKRHLETRYAGKGDGEPDKLELPPWTIGLFFLDFILFLPALLYIGYTLSHLYLTLAMVEDPSPPAYEPLSANPDDAAAVGEAEPPKPFTSSIRATSRLLRSVGGWRGHFRGIVCAFFLSVLTGAAEGFFASFTFPWIGSLLASLLLVQVSTAWVTIVISQPSPLPFYRRLPPLRKTFEATCFPVLTAWLAQSIGGGLIVGTMTLLKLVTWDKTDPRHVPSYDAHSIWKGLIVMIVAIAVSVFLVIPSQVVLRRVQASLLAPEEDPIIPFDRSFEGTVEPAIVGGKGYVNMKNAFKTFSRASWIRLYKFYIRTFLVSMAVYFVLGGIVAIEVAAVVANSSVKPGDGSN